MSMEMMVDEQQDGVHVDGEASSMLVELFMENAEEYFSQRISTRRVT